MDTLNQHKINRRQVEVQVRTKGDDGLALSMYLVYQILVDVKSAPSVHNSSYSCYPQKFLIMSGLQCLATAVKQVVVYRLPGLDSVKYVFAIARILCCMKPRTDSYYGGSARSKLKRNFFFKLTTAKKHKHCVIFVSCRDPAVILLRTQRMSPHSGEHHF